MKALILAGGLGTRLRPLTFTRPKPLLPIANRPHLEHVLNLLQRHGVDEVVLLTSYLAGSFAAVVADARRRGLGVEVTNEQEPLGTGGALKNAQEFVGDDTFLAFNGDILTTADLSAIVGWHRDRRALGTIVLTPVEDPSPYGVVPVDPDGRVLGFIEKPPPGEAPTNLINAGVYVLEPAVLDRIPEGEVWSAERQLFPGLIEEDAGLYAIAADAYWIEIGTPQKYLQANLDALSGGWRPESGPVPEGGVLAGPGVSVAAGARVSSSCLGAGCVVEDGAVVQSSVLLPGVVIGSGAVVEESVLGEGALVESGAHVVGAAIADGELVRGS